ARVARSRSWLSSLVSMPELPRAVVGDLAEVLRLQVDAELVGVVHQPGEDGVHGTLRPVDARALVHVVGVGHRRGALHAGLQEGRLVPVPAPAAEDDLGQPDAVQLGIIQPADEDVRELGPDALRLVQLVAVPVSVDVLAGRAGHVPETPLAPGVGGLAYL